MRWQAPTLNDERRRRILEVLSAPEHRRWEATATASAEAADRFLVGRMLLRELSAETLGTPIESITVLAECPSCGGPHGRPSISVAGATALHATLSHTTGLVVAAILPPTSGSAIGIDVEAVAGAGSGSDSDSDERLSAIEALVPRTADWRRGVLGGRGIRSGLRAWTRVEAVLKADGRGLRVDPSAVALRPANGGLAASVDGSETRYVVFDRGIGGRGIGRGAVMSVAVADPVSEPSPRAGRAARSSTATQ